MEFLVAIIFSLARLDAFVVTVVTCLRSRGTDKVGCHCEKLYYGTFESFFQKAFDQIASTIAIFTHLWSPIELSLSALRINEGYRE